MKTGIYSIFATLSMMLLAASHTFAAPDLEEVATFPRQQVTGVAVSPSSGRMFVNFPFWSDDHTTSVAEVKDGVTTPFPDEKWNSKEGDPNRRFVCVQSVYIDNQDALWVLDAGSPKQEGTLPGGPKLLKFDLGENKVTRAYTFSEEEAPKNSYLNDLRVDTKSGHAFITESGIGSILVVDLTSGKIHKFLANHPSTKVEPGVELTIDGIKPIDPKTGGTPRFNADGIALDTQNGLLYFHALTAHTLYQIKTSVLINPTSTDQDVEKEVAAVAKTSATDGMLADNQGCIYLTAFEKDAITRFDPATKEEVTIVSDKHFQWPDSMSWGPEGSLYVTTSQIHRMPKYNKGESKRQDPFRVYRFKPEGHQTAGTP